MAGFVVDASAALAWVFEDEVTPWTEGLLDRAANAEEIYVPAHWPLEVLNALLMAQRRERITAARIQEFIGELAALALHIAASPSPAEWEPVLRLDTRYRLTSYDAAYLALAKQTGLPLATLDKDLRRAAESAGAGLVE